MTEKHCEESVAIFLLGLFLNFLESLCVRSQELLSYKIFLVIILQK